MSKKNLLKEHEIRRMMKFANLSPLTETFIDSLEEQEADEDMPMDMGDEEGPAGEDPAEMPGEEPGGEPGDEPGEEMDDLDVPEPEAEAEGDVDVEALAKDLMAAVEKHTGVSAEV